MDVELWSGRDGDGEKFLFDSAESASGLRRDIFKRVCQILWVLETEDCDCFVGRSTGTSGEVRDTGRNRVSADSGTYAGVESERKIVVAVKIGGGESNI